MNLSGNLISGTGSYVIGEVTTAVPGLLEKGDTFLECTSAGTVAFPSKQAYGEWEFDWYKGGDANSTLFAFVNDIITHLTTNNGYEVAIGSNEPILLRRTTNGSVSTLLGTVTSYIAINTWYRFKITRTLDGNFYLYIKGGAFGNNSWALVSASGGSGTNPIINTTHVISNYFVVYVGIGDRIANIVMRKAVQQ